jgi:hypothetical protein
MDTQSHHDNNTEPCKMETSKPDIYEINDNNNSLCYICNINNKKEEFVSMVHKWREYGGYSKMIYPRYFCSTNCLEIFERDFRCNHCHIISYEGDQCKKGPDGMTYCNDECEITIGDTPCYNLCFPDID